MVTLTGGETLNTKWIQPIYLIQLFYNIMAQLKGKSIDTSEETKMSEHCHFKGKQILKSNIKNWYYHN